MNLATLNRRVIKIRSVFARVLHFEDITQDWTHKQTNQNSTFIDHFQIRFKDFTVLHIKFSHFL